MTNVHPANEARPIGRLLKRTTSRCPRCLTSCAAEVRLVDEKPAKVFLSRSCPAHGESSICIASDARFYWLSKGRPENACCGGSPQASGTARLEDCCRGADSPESGLAWPATGCQPSGTLGRNARGRGEAPFEELSTCLALIEIVNSCNLSCPVCYADSPRGGWPSLGPSAGQQTRGADHAGAVPLEELKRRIQGVVDRKGGIEILQLSGGEPTLHPDFFELVDWAQKNPGIDYLLVNSNGVLIATDESFARRLEAAARRGSIQLYLQFDGPQMHGQELLRGADLRALRRCAIERCGEISLPITLAMTVVPENMAFLWQAVEFGLQFRHVRGISFQPLFHSGRLPVNRKADVSHHPEGNAHPTTPGIENRWPFRHNHLNTADIILAAVEQSHGKLRFEDFTPLPCGDPNCATIGYLLKTESGIRSISDFVDFSKVQGFLKDKIRYRLEDLIRCGCESEPLGELLHQFEMDASNTFRLFIKPFMDAWTWDQDRIDRCCTHVIRPDGKLDSFCRYYSGFADAQAAP